MFDEVGSSGEGHAHDDIKLKEIIEAPTNSGGGGDKTRREAPDSRDQVQLMETKMIPSTTRNLVDHNPLIKILIPT